MKDQLDQLQRTVRFQQYSLLVIAMTLSVLFLSSALSQDTQELELQRLTIVNAKGEALISLGVNKEGLSEIAIHAGEERDAISLRTTELGHGAIDMFNKAGDRTVTLGGTVDGHGGVRVESEDVTPAFYMGRDLRGNGQVPEGVHAGRRLD